MRQLREREESEEMLNVQLSKNQAAAEEVISRLKVELEKEKEEFEYYKGLNTRC